MMQVTQKEKQKKESGNGVKIVQANDNVVIQNGTIANNPFIFRLEKSTTSQWMIANKSKVLNRIMYYFREYNGAGYGGNADDCFCYAVDYFMESKKRAFRKSYFGKETTYNVEQYCLTLLKYSVRNYLNELNGGLNIQSIVTAEERGERRGGCVDETLAIDQLSVEEQVMERDIDMWDEQFDWLMEYEGYFKDKNYKEFDIKGYLAYMYFDVNHIDIKDHVEHVAKSIGESVDLVKLVTQDFRIDVVNKDDVAVELLNEIKTMVKETRNGWKPKIIRNKKREEDTIGA